MIGWIKREVGKWGEEKIACSTGSQTNVTGLLL